ncbi:MAG: response regulator transcription factor [Desulfoarculaceae bacterium]|nr:response regulator transcription factor [Desulfoarculaceae bacterium]
MTAHICLSLRPEHLNRWRQAFPAGTVVDALSSISRTAEGMTLIWLHAGKLPQAHIDEAIRAVRELLSEARTVVISSTPTQQEALLALNTGASGYCHAQATPQLLQQVATVVTNGGLWIGPELMTRVMVAAASFFTPVTDHPGLEQLTLRENEVALAVGRGASNKEVAEQLEITERTVKAHLGAIFEKLGVRDRLQLVLFLSRSKSGQ